VLYLEHFGLDEPPFRITPHTDFFFDGADRGTTLDALLYAILHDEGIVKVSGEVGSGKTMLCRVLMERLPEHVEIIYLANPSLAPEEILHAISDDLRVDFSQDRATVALRELEEHLVELYADGHRVVLLIDEAHAMPEETLEQVRLLSNLESNRHKLLQIVLFGQTELDGVLDKTSMRQLKDRITHSFRMRPLSEAEVGKYLSFRMRAAGYRGPDLFNRRAVAMIAKAASGLTRRVNILADKSLLAAFTENKHAITERQARAAIRDSEFGRLLHEKRRDPILFAVSALLVGLALGAGIHWGLSRSYDEPKSPPVRASGSAASPAAEPASTPIAHPAPGPSSAALPPSPAPVPVEPAPLPTVRLPLLDPVAAKRIGSYKPGPNPILKERIAAMQERLENDPDGSYSIELFSTENSDPARMERFLVRAKELVSLEDVYVLPQVAGNRFKMRVTYGTYPDRASALLAAERLPPKYKQAFQAELRSFAELRSGL
jgi:type II secretory pathway predicted ATPase ExeA